MDLPFIDSTHEYLSESAIAAKRTDIENGGEIYYTNRNAHKLKQSIFDETNAVVYSPLDISHMLEYYKELSHNQYRPFLSEDHYLDLIQKKGTSKLLRLLPPQDYETQPVRLQLCLLDEVSFTYLGKKGPYREFKFSDKTGEIVGVDYKDSISSLVKGILEEVNNTTIVDSQVEGVLRSQKLANCTFELLLQAMPTTYKDKASDVQKFRYDDIILTFGGGGSELVETEPVLTH